MRKLLAISLICLPAGAGCSRPAAEFVPAQTPAELPGTANPRESHDAAPTPTTAFAFPKDEGGTLLQRLLPPEVRPPADDPPSAIAYPSDVLQLPALPLPSGAGSVPRFTAEVERHPRPPRTDPEEEPPSRRFETPEPPTLPVGPRVKLAGTDVDSPPPLGSLANRSPDQPMPVDPSHEASAAGLRSSQTFPVPRLKPQAPRASGAAQPPSDEPEPPARPPRTPGP
jgi:hypothetical protein